jgi:ABC-type glutathione transport system ATPase component
MDLRKCSLNNLSFTVKPGQKVALVGASGCGKSTCMALLQRLYEPQSGQILVDGIDIRDYDLLFLRSRMVIVDQNTVLFSTTIRDNLLYGCDQTDHTITDKEIVQVCKAAMAWDGFIADKPDKLMTVLSDGGKNLSGGQRQRLSIARAMLRNPDVILLDEATAALDTENESKVQAALDKLARGGSSLVIAHRLTTVMDADKIVMMDKGQKVEEGRHEELLQRRSADTPSAGDTTAAAHSGPRVLSTQDSDGINDNDTGVTLPPLLCRSASAPLDNMNLNKPPPEASYKRLWDIAHGTTDEAMSVVKMQETIEQMEGQLSHLKLKMSKMQKQKDDLVSGLEIHNPAGRHGGIRADMVNEGSVNAGVLAAGNSAGMQFSE